MSRAAAFEAHAGCYEDWFERHAAAYVSELLALRPFVPLGGRGLEIGVGSGRFAAPLGIQVGVDPSRAMLEHAHARGIEVCAATAEQLPFADASFDHLLVVTTLCFVDSPPAMLAEAWRVLRPGGALVIGFVDRDSALGQHYENVRERSVFYREATFYSSADVERMVASAGFTVHAWAQTLSHALDGMREIEAVRPGRGEAAFTVLLARKGSAP